MCLWYWGRFNRIVYLKRYLVGVKKSRLILIRKFFGIMSGFLLVILLVFLSLSSGFFLGVPFLELGKEAFLRLYIFFGVDSESLLFMFIVLLVTCLVVLFREFYIEHYNFKKYTFLTLSFFLSIVILSSSGSILNFLAGWDGLGISSLCLIMFYPNKTSMYNSFLTFFFNRLGDVFILVIFGLVFCRGDFLIFLFQNFNLLILILFLICASTKGAQFPLSSWLPAAMSAPTPISAMVHSSTLVTAGIFLL